MVPGIIFVPLKAAGHHLWWNFCKSCVGGCILSGRSANQLLQKLEDTRNIPLRNNLLKSLKFLNRLHGVLPPSIFAHDVSREGENPITGGGFAVSLCDSILALTHELRHTGHMERKEEWTIGLSEGPSIFLCVQWPKESFQGSYLVFFEFHLCQQHYLFLGLKQWSPCLEATPTSKHPTVVRS